MYKSNKQHFLYKIDFGENFFNKNMNVNSPITCFLEVNLLVITLTL